MSLNTPAARRGPIFPPSSGDQPACGAEGRPARHHARRGHLRLRRRGQPLSRGHGAACGAPRSASASERLAEAADPADARAALYHIFAANPERSAIELAERLIAHRAGADVEGVLRELGLGGQRHRDQARLVYQQRHRPAAEEEDHLAASAPITASRSPPRASPAFAYQSSRLRPADRPYPARRLPAPLSRRSARRERGGFRHASGGQSLEQTDPARRIRTRSPPSSPSR